MYLAVVLSALPGRSLPSMVGRSLSLCTQNGAHEEKNLHEAQLHNNLSMYYTNYTEELGSIKCPLLEQLVDASNQRLESDAFGDRRHGQCSLGRLTAEPSTKEFVSEISSLVHSSVPHMGASSDSSLTMVKSILTKL